MAIKQQAVAVYTIINRELIRMFRIFSQVFIPPVITTTLYFLIFGSLMGRRIGSVAGINYPLFIAPGLIMMAVISNAYANVSTSLYIARFQKSIEEILISPTHDGLLLLGFVIGGMLRALIIALLVFLVSCFFVNIELNHVGLALLVILLVSAIFSLAGFTNAMIARNFDDISIIPTFILTPLTYLGGVFYTTSMLPPLWQKISHFNPILYMVNALRYAMVGFCEVNILTSLYIIGIILLILIALNMVLLKKGVGLRE